MADDAAIQFLPADLAAGDTRSLELDVTGLEVIRIPAAEHPLFDAAYGRLWAEFGAAHEMEPADLIAARLAWHPVKALQDGWLRYEMLLVRRQEEFVAVRDQTAIVTQSTGGAQAIVHLSHVLVDPAWRRTGLAGWLRAWPIQTARACLAAAGCPAATPVTLVAEMENPDPAHPNRLIRLRAYEKAGFRKVDPAVVRYFQPDFRPPALIDASGGPHPLPFSLVIRRVGRETEPAIRGAEVRAMVECLYRMYGTGFRRQDMAVAAQSLRSYPEDGDRVALVPPTQ